MAVRAGSTDRAPKLVEGGAAALAADLGESERGPGLTTAKAARVAHGLVDVAISRLVDGAGKDEVLAILDGAQAVLEAGVDLS